MTSGGFVLSEREDEAAGPAGRWGNVPDGMSGGANSVSVHRQRRACATAGMDA